MTEQQTTRESSRTARGTRPGSSIAPMFAGAVIFAAGASLGFIAGWNGGVATDFSATSFGGPGIASAANTQIRDTLDVSVVHPTTVAPGETFEITIRATGTERASLSKIWLVPSREGPTAWTDFSFDSVTPAAEAADEGNGGRVYALSESIPVAETGSVTFSVTAPETADIYEWDMIAGDDSAVGGTSIVIAVVNE